MENINIESAFDCMNQKRMEMHPHHDKLHHMPSFGHKRDSQHHYSQFQIAGANMNLTKGCHQNQKINNVQQSSRLIERRSHEQIASAQQALRQQYHLQKVQAAQNAAVAQPPSRVGHYRSHEKLSEYPDQQKIGPNPSLNNFKQKKMSTGINLKMKQKNIRQLGCRSNDNQPDHKRGEITTNFIQKTRNNEHVLSKKTAPSQQTSKESLNIKTKKSYRDVVGTCNNIQTQMRQQQIRIQSNESKTSLAKQGQMRAENHTYCQGHQSQMPVPPNFVNKENVSNNCVEPQIVSKYQKFIGKVPNSNLMNSNNINVRRNFGSNDSYTNHAPHQKKYQITNKFNKSQEKKQISTGPNANTTNKAVQRKISIQNYNNLRKFSNNLVTNAAEKGTCHTRQTSGSENISSCGNHNDVSQKDLPLRDITRHVNDKLKYSVNEGQELMQEFHHDNKFSQFIEATTALESYRSNSQIQIQKTRDCEKNQIEKQNNQLINQMSNNVSNQLLRFKKQILINQMSQQALFQEELQTNKINHIYSADNSADSDQKKNDKQTQQSLGNQPTQNSQETLYTIDNLEMTDKENAASVLDNSKGGSFLNNAKTNLRTVSTNIPGIKTQQIQSGKAIDLSRGPSTMNTRAEVSSIGSRQRSNGTSSYNTKVASLRGGNVSTKNSHIRHYKSLSNASGDDKEKTQSSSINNAAPLRVNNNCTNLNNGQININNLNAGKNQKATKFAASFIDKSKNVAPQTQQRAKSTNNKVKCGVPLPQVKVVVTSSATDAKRQEKLVKFKEMIKEKKDTGILYDRELKDIQESLQQKELVDNAMKSLKSTNFAQRSPIEGHDVTKEYRTKMMDWMVEVCTSFKCTTRTYFLATQVFDKYLLKLQSQNKFLNNKDVHCIGVTSMYMASKYEDIFPLHSKIVSEKIAHKAISPKEILKKESEYLRMFDFEIDFVTHYDFHQTYVDKVERSLGKSNKKLMKLISEMSMLLIKMSIQNVDYCKYSPSMVVISTIYAATAFLKHSKKNESPETSKFCTEVRALLFQILNNELKEQDKFLSPAFKSQLEKRLGNSPRNYISNYQKQYTQQTVEKIAMDLVDFFKIFDDWHCGLNQLKKFNKVPIE